MFGFVSRRVRFIAAVALAAMPLALASTATASWDNWAFFLRAATASYTDFGTPAVAQAAGPYHDDYVSGEDIPLGTTIVTAKVAFNRPSWPSWTATTGTTSLYKVDRRAPIYTTPKVWDDIIVWVAPGYARSSLRLYWYIPTQAPVDMGSGGGPGLGSFKLEILNDPTGQHAGETLIDWRYGDGAKSGGGYQSALGYVDWTQNLDVLRLTDEQAAAGGIRMRLTVTGQAPWLEGAVPEPSGLLALAAGLGGLVAVVRRRVET